MKKIWVFGLVCSKQRIDGKISNLSYFRSAMLMDEKAFERGELTYAVSETPNPLAIAIAITEKKGIPFRNDTDRSVQCVMWYPVINAEPEIFATLQEYFIRTLKWEQFSKETIDFAKGHSVSLITNDL